MFVRIKLIIDLKQRTALQNIALKLIRLDTMTKDIKYFRTAALYFIYAIEVRDHLDWVIIRFKIIRQNDLELQK